MFFRRPDSSSISSLPAVSRLRPLCYADVTLAPACPTSVPACQARSAAGNMQEARVEHGTELTARHGFDPSPAAPHSATSSVANVLGEADDAIDAASTVTDPPATSLVAASQAHHHIESSDTGRAYGWGALRIGRFDCSARSRTTPIATESNSLEGMALYIPATRFSANEHRTPWDGRATTCDPHFLVQPTVHHATVRISAESAGAVASGDGCDTNPMWV